MIDQCSGLRLDCLIKMQRAETRRSWEEWASAYQWEQRTSAPDSSSDEADIEDCTRDDRGEALGELLVHLLIQRVLSAKQFSIICWWAAKVGAVGPVNPCALGPNSQTGAHQRHVDRCLGLDQSADDSYVIQAQGYDKFDVPRSVHDIPWPCRKRHCTMSSRARLRCWKTFNRWSTVMLCRQRALHILWSRRPTGRQSFRSLSTATAHRSPKRTGFLHSGSRT